MSPTDPAVEPLAERTAALGDRLRDLACLPTLSSPRARLRGPKDDDVDAVYALFSDPESMRYWSRPPMRQRREAEAYLESIPRGVTERSYLNWIIADPGDDRMIGTCTLYDLQVPHLRAGVGYALLTEARGRGLATDAVGLALRYAFGQLGLNRIEADAHPDNERSRLLLQRLGFQFEGRLRQRFGTGVEIQDSAIYGLLAEEWRRHWQTAG